MTLLQFLNPFLKETYVMAQIEMSLSVSTCSSKIVWRKVNMLNQFKSNYKDTRTTATNGWFMLDLEPTLYTDLVFLLMYFSVWIIFSEVIRENLVTSCNS